jgi:hypothetical protein
MGYLFGQKRRKVGRLQRQAARCFLIAQTADNVELGTWCWPPVVLIERRPLREAERSSMCRAARSVGARRVRRVGRNNWIWRLPDDVAARWRWCGCQLVNEAGSRDHASEDETIPISDSMFGKKLEIHHGVLAINKRLIAGLAESQIARIMI